MLDAGMARLAGLPGACALVRLSGNEEFVSDQAAKLAAIGDVVAAPDGTWERLRAAEPAGATTLRLSRRPSRVAEVWRAATSVASPTGGGAHLSVRRGVARCILPAAGDPTASLAAASFGGTVRFERLPAEPWRTLAPSAVDDR